MQIKIPGTVVLFFDLDKQGVALAMGLTYVRDYRHTGYVMESSDIGVARFVKQVETQLRYGSIKLGTRKMLRRFYEANKHKMQVPS